MFSLFCLNAAVLLASDKNLLPFSLIVAFFSWLFALLNRIFLPDFDLEVWDTWGLKIKDYGTKGWDGTYKGRNIRSGTYFYNAKIPTLATPENPSGIVIITGAVTVLRDGDRP